MKNVRSIIALGIFISLHSFDLIAATNTHALLMQAAQAYDSGEYAEAIEIWEGVYAERHTDPQLLINIGHAHALNGNTAEAMTAYEKALRFRPADKELQQAIHQLRERNENSVEQVDTFFISRWLNVFFSVVRPYVWSLGGLLLLLIGLFNWLSVLHIIKGKFQFPGGFKLYGILGLLFIVIGIFSYRNIYRLNEAIVYTTCDVHQGPSGQSPLVRSLHEGEKVKCRDHVSGWTKVQLLNMDEGWIKDECIRTIDIHKQN